MNPLQKQSTIREFDFSDASAKELLRGIVNYNSGNMNVPNMTWYRRYFKILGKEMVLAEGFGPQGTDGWIERSYFKKCLEDPRMQTNKDDIIETVIPNDE